MIVWLSSYPRSGNTFFRVILNHIFDIKTYSIYNDRGDIGADEATSEVVGHEFLPENFDLENARKSNKIHYIKTHELLDMRVDENDKVIYLIRDGREATLSFTKHQNTFANHNKKLIDTIYGNTFIGSWGEHVASWNPQKRKNTLLIKFEELTKNPVGFIERLSEFLAVNPVGDKIPSFEELKQINPKFFRSGKTDSWKDAFTAEEHLSFWLKNYKQMDTYGYDDEKPDLLKEIDMHRFVMESINQNNYLMDLIREKTKYLEAINKKLDRFHIELAQKQNIIDQKNEELAQKQNIIDQKNEELAQKQNIIDQGNEEFTVTKNKLTKLVENLEDLTHCNTINSPFNKFKLYKQLIDTYYIIKEKNFDK